ncbi:serine protease [Chromatiaceae bacterium AAb-1]|nr:serine protease [Chromatiaceae bacterium AAb-1]
MRTFLLVILLLCYGTPATANLAALIPGIKPSIVAIGIFNPTASPRVRLVGTGFVIAPGNRIITNYHVISGLTDDSRNEKYVVLSGQGKQIKMLDITDKAIAPQYDLAMLKISETLPALKLGNGPLLAEGSPVAFTGFPILAVLGLYPATHTGIISAITPIAIPADNAIDLKSQALRRLEQPYLIYQLDATAYPGNSGSPLYRHDTGEVIGIINQVYVKSSREAVLSDPSGITYAIPVQFINSLLNQP